jgi:ABC-type Fe3+ transport system permease subunit
VSFTTALVFSFGRSVLIAATASLAATSFNRLLNDLTGICRWICWILLVVPWLVPGLLVGYAWNGWLFAIHGWAIKSDCAGLASVSAFGLNHEWAGNELVLCTLLLCRSLPWAVVMLRWGVSLGEAESSWFLRGLSPVAEMPTGGNGGAGFLRRLRRNGLQLAPALGLAFLTCFQEYELVARLGRPAWTVWLIDAQATGVPVWGLLFRATIAAGLQALLLGALLPIRSGLFLTTSGRLEQVSEGFSRRLLIVGMLMLGVTSTVVVPLLSLAPGFFQGISALTYRTPVLRRLVAEVTVGVAVAMLAATTAMLLAKVLEITPRKEGFPPPDRSTRRPPDRSRLVGIGNWVHRGLFWLGAWGAVPLCLLTLNGLAACGWTFLYQTVLPWSFVQTIWLFPRAVCLMSLLRAWRQPQVAHLGTLLSSAPDVNRRNSAQQLWWRENWRNPVMAGIFLVMTAYFDLPTGQILAPAGLASAPVTLYTQMHYGRNALLTAMTLLAVAIPWTLAILALIVLPRLPIWRRAQSISVGGWRRSR